ncbi:MAG: hypothetical protein H6618_00655 [Deltaproteobacteria bacterium]|nr:hypothetical protein [Deltaproteobacteria bacterium]
MGKKLVLNKNKNNEDGWLTSYADLMSLLSCFFLLLYNVGESDPVRQRKIEEGIVAKFSPKKAIENKEVSQDKDEIHRAFYILMSIVNMEKESYSVAQKINKIYHKEKTLDAIKKHLTEKNADSLKKIGEKVGKSDVPDSDIIEFVLNQDSRTRSDGSLTEDEKQQVQSVTDILKYHKDLIRVEVVRYRPPGDYKTSDPEYETSNRFRQLQIANTMSEMGIPDRLIKISDEISSSENLAVRRSRNIKGIQRVGIRVLLQN